jgi:hypothetical protein
MFGRLNTTTGAITYSEMRYLGDHLSYILVASTMLGYVKRSMDYLDKAVLEVSNLHHAAHPVIDE